VSGPRNGPGTEDGLVLARLDLFFPSAAARLVFVVLVDVLEVGATVQPQGDRRVTVFCRRESIEEVQYLVRCALQAVLDAQKEAAPAPTVDLPPAG
jgi:hypothetical protein